MQPFKVDAEGNLVYKPDGKDGYIAGLENGKTYKVSVRAVNRNSADGTVAYGEWSDAVDYTYAKKVAKPKSVTIYAAERKNQIQVSGENQNLEVSIKDEAGNEYYSYAYGAKEPSYVTASGNWLNFYENYGYLLKKNDTTGLYEVASDADGKYIGAFQKGKKYTVKVRAYTGSGDEKKVGDWSNELVVEADDSGSLVPEKTGNFKYNDEYEYVSWNRIQNTYVSQYEVEVDGKEVSKTNYKVIKGSTIVTFNKEYLESLPVGNHEVKVYFEDGYATTTLIIKEQTKDNNEKKDTISNNQENVKAENNALAQDANWKNEKLKVGDVVYRNYDGFVTQEGVFGQVEFNRNALATFIAGSVSNTMYWRYDRFYYDKAHAKSGKADFWSGTVKGGANYNLDEHNNVFANIGFISKAPFFEYAVFLNKENSNELNKDAVNEKIFSVELGYGFRSPVFTANLNLYRTAWMDKSMGASVTFQDSDERGRINMTGVDALHQGVELEVTVKPVRNLELTGMLSLADWRWNSRATGYLYNDQGIPLTKDGVVTTEKSKEHAKVDVDLKDVKVGNSAQTTFAFGANYQVLKGLRLGADYTHWARNYAKFKLQGSDLSKELGKTMKYDTPWKIPSAGSMDVNMSYRFPLGKVWGIISANVNNVLDQEYISDAEDGTTHDWTTAQVYYGFGRTYSVRFKITF